MKILFKTIFVFLFLAIQQWGNAQHSIREYVEKYDSKKIQKSMLTDVLSVPTTAKSFRDGHGKTPYLSAENQLPDTIALVAFNIRDLGDVNFVDAGYVTFITYTCLSAEGGNMIANAIYNASIEKLKEMFKKEGVVLLTPEEFLDTPAKRSFYYDEFTPKVSKLGDWLSGIESRGTQMSTSADYFRTFDLSAAADYKRSISLGDELARVLGVDAVLSIGTVLQTNKKEGYLRSMKMAIHGPNPIPKEDKKYAAQKLGNGYNDGLLYISLNFMPKKAVPVLAIKKGTFTDINFDGLDVIMENFIAKTYSIFHETVAKNQ